MPILKYKKTAFWVSIAAVALCIVVAVCFMTKREETDVSEGSTDLEEAVSQALLKDYRRRFFPANECDGVGYVIFGSDESGDIVKVYGWMQYSQFGFEDDRFVARDGSSSAFVMTLQRDEQEILTMKKVEYPIDGEPNRDSLKKSFPEKYWNNVLSGPSAAERKSMIKQTYLNYAKPYLQSIGREYAMEAPLNEALNDIVRRPVYISDFDVTVNVPFEIYEREVESLYGYPGWIGTRESIEDGVRYVYRTSFDQERYVVIYEKYEYETRKIVELTEVDTHDGKIIKHTSGGNVAEETTATTVSGENFTTTTVPVKENTTQSTVSLPETSVQVPAKTTQIRIESVTPLDTPQPREIGDNLFYFDISDAAVEIDGKQTELSQALKNGTLTTDLLLNMAEELTRRRMVREVNYKDGGSQAYYADEWCIIKKHSLDGDRRVFLGTQDMDINNLPEYQG